MNESILTYRKIVNSNPKYEIEKYCLESILEEGSWDFYKSAAKLALKLNVKKVYDIGSCIAIQRYNFEELGIDYIPVDYHPVKNINNALNGLICRKYPFHIAAKSDEALISHLCLSFFTNIINDLPYLLDFKTVILGLSYKTTAAEIKEIEKYFTVSIMTDQIGQKFWLLERK